MEAICFQMDGVTVELPHSQLRETSRGRTAPQKSRGQRRLPLFLNSARAHLADSHKEIASDYRYTQSIFVRVSKQKSIAKKTKIARPRTLWQIRGCDLQR